MVSELKVQKHWEFGLRLRCGKRSPQCDDLAIRVPYVESLPDNDDGQAACPVGAKRWYKINDFARGRLCVCGSWVEGRIVGVATEVPHRKSRQELPSI